MKAWMGFGISNYYKKFSRNIEEKIHFLKFDEYVFLIADEMQRKYNGYVNKEIKDLIYDSLKTIPSVTLVFSKDLEQRINLKKIYPLCRNNKFLDEVNSLVKTNRPLLKESEIPKARGYVFEELALIEYFYNQGYYKMGPKEKEHKFDQLAQKYLKIPEECFIYI